MASATLRFASVERLPYRFASGASGENGRTSAGAAARGLRVRGMEFLPVSAGTVPRLLQVVSTLAVASAIVRSSSLRRPGARSARQIRVQAHYIPVQQHTGFTSVRQRGCCDGNSLM